MRILAVSELDLNTRDGSTTHFLELFRHLSESCKVRILVPDFGGEIHEKLDIEYARTLKPQYANRDSKLFFVAKILFFLSYQFSLFFRIVKIAKKDGIDIIYSRQGMLSVSQFLAAKFSGIPLVSEVNGILSEELRMVGVPALFVKYFKRFERIVLRHSRGVITVSEPIKSFLRTEYSLEQPIHIVPNGSNVDLFRPLDKEACRNELNLETEGKYVGYVGYLAPWQGVDYLVRAAPFVLKEIPSAKILIIGDGPSRRELESTTKDLKLENNVIFSGSVAYGDVVRYINACDVCVAPFLRRRNEITGLSPIKIYEYLACERPVVATDIRGVGDFLVETNTGIAVEPENETELAKGIMALLRDEELGKNMGMKGREVVVKNHSWSVISRKVKEVLEGVAQ
jgi:glycosyltransferase involved in cell wall biosynthesis